MALELQGGVTLGSSGFQLVAFELSLSVVRACYSPKFEPDPEHVLKGPKLSYQPSLSAVGAFHDEALRSRLPYAARPAAFRPTSA